MIQELLFTSAPAGLNPNDQGFCTVLCTQGLPRNLKEFLEGLSGYRQAEKPPHPVNYSHLVRTVGGKRYHVLSRVADCEKDYSGRTNKLAHHVAMTGEDLTPAGPAALLQTPLCRTTWDGQPRYEPQPPILPSANPHRGACRHWESLTGDGGWAGVLAEAAADGSNRPMYVIFPAGQDVLPLVGEALSILPPEKHWSTTFSTYFTKLPAGVDCVWRFVLDGSPEAKQARAASHGRTIDLIELGRSRRAAPVGNPYVDAARAGRVMASDSHMGGTFAPSKKPGPASAPAVAPLPVPEAEAEPEPVAVPASPYSNQATPPASPFGPRPGEEVPQSKLPLILGISSAVVLIGVGALVYSMLTNSRAEERLSQKNANTKPKPTADTVGVPVGNYENPQQKAERLKAEKDAKDARIAKAAKDKADKAAAEKKKRDDDAKRLAALENEKPNLNQNVPPVKVIAWDRSLKKIKEKPFKIGGDSHGVRGGNSKEEFKELATIFVESPTQVKLVLHSVNGSSPPNKPEEDFETGIKLRPQEPRTLNAKSVREWKVVNQGSRDQAIGIFQLIDSPENEESPHPMRLRFLWEQEAPTKERSKLLNCVLEIRHLPGKHNQEKSEQAYYFALSEPRIVESVKFTELSGKLSKLVMSSEVLLDSVPDPNKLHLDLKVKIPNRKVLSKPGMKVGDTAILPQDDSIKYEITFQYSGEGDLPFHGECARDAHKNRENQ